MSKIVVGVTDFIGKSLDSKFRELSNKIDELEKEILDLELETCKKNKVLFLSKQELEKLEQRIILITVNNRK